MDDTEQINSQVNEWTLGYKTKYSRNLVDRCRHKVENETKCRVNLLKEPSR